MERARTIDIIFAQERILAGQFLIMVANEQGNARSGDLPRAPPPPRCAQASPLKMHSAKQNNSPADQASIYDAQTLTTFACAEKAHSPK